MSHLLPALIFDLDGTLTDSKPGIFNSLRKAIAAHSIENAGDLERFLGPPVEEWVTDLLPNGSEEEQAALARDYRAFYDREGWAINSVYPGMREVLGSLQRKGFPLYVCTSKQEHFAVRILEKFELAHFFSAIYGDKAEYASHSKVDLLALLLREQGLGHRAAWMIGDRTHDIEAAHGNGIRCIAVRWGYGSAEERAQADAIAETPADLLTLAAPQEHAPTPAVATSTQLA